MPRLRIPPGRVPSPSGPDPQFRGRQAGDPAQQRRQHWRPGDLAGLADSRFGGFDLTQAGEVPDVIEQAVSEVVRVLCSPAAPTAANAGPAAA
jgi:hypothetical protein